MYSGMGRYAVVSYLGDSSKVIKDIEFFNARSLEAAYQRFEDWHLDLKIIIPVNNSNKRHLEKLLGGWSKRLA